MEIIDPKDLPLTERVQWYRSLAKDAERNAAASTTSTMRESYQLMAERWAKLADDIEARLSRPQD